MKIAIISPGSFSVPPVIGSSVEHDIQMVAEQMEKDHQVTVYTKKYGLYKKSTKEGNLHYKRLKFRTYDVYLKRVIRHLKKHRPDVIMVENRPSYVLRLKDKFPDIPVVLNMHSTVFASPPHISKREMTDVAKRVDALITNSKYLKDYYTKHFSDLKDKAHAVHLGIDPDPFSKAQEREKKVQKLKKKFRIKEKDQTLLFVGRLLKQKGIHLVLDVLPKLIKSHPNLKLIITGSSRYGKNILTPYVKGLRKKTVKLRKHIVFTNFIPPKKIPYVYQLADIVVIPSIWQEPFGRVNLEAMAATKAVVASDRGGIPEVIKHEENGFIISLDKYKEELVESISTLLQSEELREEYGKRGLELVKEFSWSKTANKYLDIYRELLYSHKPDG
jgi:spore coat protein SA